MKLFVAAGFCALSTAVFALQLHSEFASTANSLEAQFKSKEAVSQVKQVEEKKNTPIIDKTITSPLPQVHQPAMVQEDRSIIVVQSIAQVRDYALSHPFITKRTFTTVQNRNTILEFMRSFQANSVVTMQLDGSYHFYFFK